MTIYQVHVPLLPTDSEGQAVEEWLLRLRADPALCDVPPAVAAVKGATAFSLAALADRHSHEAAGSGCTKAASPASRSGHALASGPELGPLAEGRVRDAASGGGLAAGFVADAEADQRTASLGLRVLAVDDERSNRLIIKRMLDRLGCTSVIVTEGDEAIAELQRVGQAAPSYGSASSSATAITPTADGAARFDVVLMDIAMKRTDGVSTCSTMRDLLGVTVPIIATSGNRPHSIDTPSFARFNAFILKPFTVRDLSATLVACTSTPAVPLLRTQAVMGFHLAADGAEGVLATADAPERRISRALTGSPGLAASPEATADTFLSRIPATGTAGPSTAVAVCMDHPDVSATGASAALQTVADMDS